MTGSSYKLILLGRNSWREAEFTPETEDGFRIGTDRSCAMRYHRDYFFDDFYLEFRRTGAGGWRLQCSEGVHVTQDGVLKLQSLELVHGLSFQIFDRSDMELFKCSFLLDFERAERAYRREITLDGVDRLTIGGQAEHIVLTDELVGRDTLTLVREEGGWRLSDEGTHYGVAYNGSLITAPVHVGELDFFSLVGYAFFLKDGRLYTDPAPGMDIRLPWRDLPETNNQFRYPGFNRSTRLQYQVPEEEIEVLPPAAKKDDRRKSLLFSLIPSLATLILIVLLRGVMGGGGSFVLYSACSMTVGIVMSIATYVSDGRRIRRDEEKRQADYQAYIAAKRQRIEELRRKELETLRAIYISLEEDLRRAEDFDERLFERAPEDADFLRTYLGSGEIPAPNQLKITPQEFHNGEDPLTEVPEQLAEEYRCLPDGPVTADLQGDNCLGIVGGPEALDGALRALTADLAARHYFRDVKLAYLLGDREFASFRSLRWLPHVQAEEGGVRYLGHDEESREMVLEGLYATLSAREAAAAENEGRNAPPLPHFVVFIYGELSLTKHPISRYFERAGGLGCTFLFFVRHKELLPRGCGEVLFLESGGSALVPAANAACRQTLVPAGVEALPFRQMVQKLAATRIDQVSLEAELTQNISLFELLGLMEPEDLALEARWKESQVFRSMAAPLGVNRKGEAVLLDIGDKAGAHGPHGLVAGTTGSGKSELLQTYILSMATLFHPYDVSFLLIDFKGGGMANQFRELPHLLGAITNIDGREITRSLLSIKAELLRRQAIFAETGVNHINDYIRKFKKHEVEIPLPHLIIIVDEFAELKSEFPDFMKELISAARIGRTLGIHLILATQKPSGVVDAQIWANSRFRLCLKVQNKEDSNEVLKSPLAAEIKEPGRAYFQVGNNEIFELFQSAYGGAPVPDVEAEQSRSFTISAVSPSGKREVVFSSRMAASQGGRPSQQDALVAYIAAYCRDGGIQPLPGICLPPLAEQIQLSELAQPARSGGQVSVAVGLYDDPEQQTQAPFVLHLSAENCFVVGASQMGKTNFLRTLACALIAGYTPAEVNLYCIDCGSMALKGLESSAHVGGVVLVTEEEKMENLFKLLHRLVSRRRAAFAAKGLSTYAAYLEAGFRDLPQVVVLLDNVAAFREYYDRLMDSLLVLTREGLSAGISFVLTGVQSNALSYKTLANFSSRVAFTCTDSGEYGNLFGRTHASPRPVPGRALVQQEKRVVECQIAVTGTAAREIERVEELRAFLAGRNGECPGQRAEPIPMVPETLAESELFQTQRQRFLTPYLLPIGMDYGQVELLSLELLQTGSFVLTGPDGAGRLGFLRYLLSALNRTIVFSETEAYICDDPERPLRQAEDYGYVRQYTHSREEAVACLEEVAGQLKRRRERMEPQALQEEPLILVVLESRALLQSIGGDRTLAQLLLELVRGAQESRALILFSNLDNAAPAFNAPEVLKFLREQRQGMVFGPLAECRFYEVQPRQSREFSQTAKSGDCFLFRGSQIFRMKAIQKDGGSE